MRSRTRQTGSSRDFSDRNRLSARSYRLEDRKCSAEALYLFLRHATVECTECPHRGHSVLYIRMSWPSTAQISLVSGE